MEMKHYKDAANKTYGFAADGSQDHLKPEGLVEISKTECDALGMQNFQAAKEAELASADYVRQRIAAYPEIGEFLDAFVKGDGAAIEEYKRKCLEVKAKYPKPAGF